MRRTALNGSVSIGAVMKQEAPYIVEWVAWHRALGFELIIADNGGTDGTSELLAKLHQIGQITRVDVRHLSVKPQVPAYNVMLRLAASERVDSLGFLDTDEFFEPLCAGTFDGCGPAIVRHLLEPKYKIAVGFNWMCFGSSHLEKVSGNPVALRFTWSAERDAKVNNHFKSFFRVEPTLRALETEEGTKLHPHGPAIDSRYYYHDAGPMTFSPEFGRTARTTWKHARIRHYVTKTFAEFIRSKVARGRADAKNNADWYTRSYFERHDTNDVETPCSAVMEAHLKAAVTELAQEIATVHLSPLALAPLSFAQTLRLYWQARPFGGSGLGPALDKGLRTAALCLNATYLRRRV